MMLLLTMAMEIICAQLLLKAMLIVLKRLAPSSVI